MGFEPELIEGARDRGGDLVISAVGGEPQSSGVLERLRDGEIRMDDLVLGQIPDVGQPCADGLAIDGDRATRWGCDAGERLEQRRLARAALADEGDELAGLDAERRLGQDLLFSHAHRHALGVESQRALLGAGDEGRPVEDEPVRSDAHLGARLQQCRAHELAVDPRAVARAEVADRDAIFQAGHLRVEARDVRVLQNHVVGPVSPQGEVLLGELDDLHPAHRRLRGAPEASLLTREEAQHLLADHDRVSVCKPARLISEALPVELRAVLATEVGDPVTTLCSLDASVVAGNGVLGDREVVVGQPPDRPRGLQQHEALAAVQHGRGRADRPIGRLWGAARAVLHQPTGDQAASHRHPCDARRAPNWNLLSSGASPHLSTVPPKPTPFTRGARLPQDRGAVQRPRPYRRRYLRRARTVSM